MTKSEELLELIAAECHNQWCEWMRYLLNKAISYPLAYEPITEVEIGWEVGDYGRWRMQMKTSYKDLSGKEQESDRVEARKILAIITQFNDENKNE